MLRSPEAQQSVECYFRNLAVWLAGKKFRWLEAEKRLDHASDEALEESLPADNSPAIIWDRPVDAGPMNLFNP
jgi:hypothetical protein